MDLISFAIEQIEDFQLYLETVEVVVEQAIDEALLAKAAKLAGPLDRSAVIHEGLKALIERESAKRLARLGGTR